MDITEDFKYIIVVGIFCVYGRATWVCLPMDARATCAGEIMKSFTPYYIESSLYHLYIVADDIRLSRFTAPGPLPGSMNSPTAVTFC